MSNNGNGSRLRDQIIVRLVDLGLGGLALYFMYDITLKALA